LIDSESEAYNRLGQGREQFLRGHMRTVRALAAPPSSSPNSHSACGSQRDNRQTPARDRSIPNAFGLHVWSAMCGSGCKIAIPAIYNEGHPADGSAWTSGIERASAYKASLFA
jgi:hypothetical protein